MKQTLSVDIKCLKKELNDHVNTGSPLNSEVVLKLSQELDELIVAYYKSQQVKQV